MRLFLLRLVLPMSLFAVALTVTACEPSGHSHPHTTTVRQPGETPKTPKPSKRVTVRKVPGKRR
jgi:hypothetical protein